MIWLALVLTLIIGGVIGALAEWAARRWTGRPR